MTRKRNLVYKPRRLRKPPPFLEDHTLRSIGLGLLIGEGMSGCKNRSPQLRVRMCDLRAMKMLTRSWGTSIVRGRRLGCKPTPENPEGRPYETAAYGTRAQAIMRAYEPEILGTEIHEAWQKAQQECPKRPVRKRPT